jgi:hypothetical protein
MHIGNDWFDLDVLNDPGDHLDGRFEPGPAGLCRGAVAGRLEVACSA